MPRRVEELQSMLPLSLFGGRTDFTHEGPAILILRQQAPANIGEHDCRGMRRAPHALEALCTKA